MRHDILTHVPLNHGDIYLYISDVHNYTKAAWILCYALQQNSPALQLKLHTAQIAKHLIIHNCMS